MKKVLKFLRSMRFGILLLVLIAALSVLGSVIPQNNSASWYVQNYPDSHPWLFRLLLNDIFHSWYFLTLIALLCLNLFFCSLTRIVSVVRSGKRFTASAAALPNSRALSAAQRQRLEEHLLAVGCRREDHDGARVYVKNRIGRYGSFVTHLAILLTVLFGAAALTLPWFVDMDCMPGESIRLPEKDGGTALFSLASFRITDENGRLDYTSDLTITLPDGRSSSGSVSVNHPLSCGPYKVYQQQYGYAASVTVTNLAGGGSDLFLLTDLSLISLNNHDGVWFIRMYPDHILHPDGRIEPVSTGDNSYPHPVYYAQTVEGAEAVERLFLPGDEVELGGLRYHFNEPAPYPVLRIKHTPHIVNVLLIVSFALMVAGLWILFFMPPVLVKVDDEGYAVGGPKPEGMRLDLERVLSTENKEDKR